MHEAPSRADRSALYRGSGVGALRQVEKDRMQFGCLAVASGSRYASSRESCNTRRSGGLTLPCRSPANKSAAKAVARTNPYLGLPIASLIAPIASGARTAERQVKNKSTPAPAPCFDLGRQLMPLELMVG